MKKLECIVRPARFETVKNDLASFGIKGMTVTQVIGCGLQQGKTEYYRGTEYTINLLPKVKLEIVVQDGEVEQVSAIVRQAALTGKIGDGKIFIYDVADVIRIRTGERGEDGI